MADELIRAQDLKQVMHRYLARLREHKEALNRLNVYPVPDGDTGTNMTLTVESVVGALDGASSMAEVSRAMARGSLMGAQGNSGIILSQILRAFADIFEAHREIGAAEIAEGLDKASQAAYKAVGRPVEGTILTVLRRAAEAAGGAAGPGPGGLGALVERVYRQAEQTLLETPELLPVLKAAGVVDAGGAGLLLLLACMKEHVAGGKVVLPPAIFKPAAQLVSGRGGGQERTIADLQYEVMFFLEGEAGADQKLKEAWGAIGDSVVIVGGEGTWNCHIHTDDIGAAVEAGVEAGRPRGIKITDLLAQAETEEFHRAATFVFEPLPEALHAKVGLVAVANGPGVVEIFRRYFAQGVVVGGQTMNPSVGDLLEVVDAVPAKTVVLLPNNKNIIPAAEEIDQLTKKQVYVVPTRSVPQGVAAALAYGPEVAVETVLSRMDKASRRVRSGEMTQAVRDATTPAGAIKEGDWIGLVDGKVQMIHPSQPGRIAALLTRLIRLVLGAKRAERRTRRLQQQAFAAALVALLQKVVDAEAEAVTIITGAGADAEVTAAGRAWLDEYRSGIPTDVVDGGQPLYPYLIGVE